MAVGGLRHPLLAGSRHRHQLDNGLQVLVSAVPGSAVVSTALWYRVGARDEPRGQAGLAHFLEHMMFKGSPRYGPGQVDRRTQALGGVNNAFTSHDATVYYFKLSPAHWREALAIEADRMAALTLGPEAVSGERQVILEEIAMYESDPWDALEQAVAELLYGGHCYARPVLGTRLELASLGGDELAAFHRRHYRPDNALLVVAGGVAIAEATAAVEGALGALPGGAAGRPRLSQELMAPPGLRRLERAHGEVPRMLLLLPAPPADHPDHPLLRVLAAALAEGRTSRLHDELVEEREACLWVSAEVSATEGPGSFAIQAELHAGAEPAAVEESVLRHLAALRAEVMAAAELERCRQGVLADWLFAHEQVHQQGLSLGFGAALFGDEAYVERSLWQASQAAAGSLVEAARRWLDPDAGGVVGWTLPAEAR
ncbi:MAG TPA: pitrilysin family protein [Thermoanaerobaculia bacterium]|nr:pitrilysin family protein [Thermoanaerobaculia bacterium]